jgi:tetratricopeptide (TPR) repeat protein
MALVIAGEYARAIDATQAHMRADPFYPARTVLWLGIAYYMLKRHSEALPDLREAVSRAPNTLGCHLWSAGNFAQLKRLEEAQREVGTVLQIDSA